MEFPDIHGAMQRHERIAFQFSGGRDSTAALYVMRPFWDRLTVYHVDTGDQFPELRAVVDAVERDTGLPIVRITSDVIAYWREVGYPSDIVPFDNTAIGRDLSGKKTRIVGRMECCSTNLMMPLHRRMIEDDMTLLVRGTRVDEFAHLPIRSGFRDADVELLYPIQHWSAQEVTNYLTEHGRPIAPFYAAGLDMAPECLGCTAWWDEGRLGYMRARYPVAAKLTERNMRVIRLAVHDQLEQLDKELTP